MKLSKLGLEVNESISHATFRSQDLIPAFLEVLNNDQDIDKLISDLPFTKEELMDSESEINWESEELSYFLNETLFDLLQEYAPTGYYFGSHEGNGSDFAFWKIEDEDFINNAQLALDYYSHDDFKGNYVQALCDDLEYRSEESIAEEIESYNFMEDTDHKIDNIEEFTQFIYDNIEEYITDFYNYYVGDYCIASVAFGEQCEEIGDEDQQMYEDVDFFVIENYAYYDLSDTGMCVKLSEQLFADYLQTKEE